MNTHLSSQLFKLLISRLYRYFIVIVLPVVQLYGQHEIAVSFKLSDTRFYQEIKAGKKQNAAITPPNTKKNKPTYRYFTVGAEYNETMERFYVNHWKLLEQFKSTFMDSSLQTQSNYLNFVRRVDQPHFAFYYQQKRLNPSIEFQFQADSTSTYHLDSIGVSIYAYDEYRGGGIIFSPTNWKDIQLKSKTGKFVLSNLDEFSFIGSGKLNLCVGSDNFKPQVMLTPSGCYLLELIFFFSSGNQQYKAKTGQFKMDV